MLPFLTNTNFAIRKLTNMTMLLFCNYPNTTSKLRLSISNRRRKFHDIRNGCQLSKTKFDDVAFQRQ